MAHAAPVQPERNTLSRRLAALRRRLRLVATARGACCLLAVVLGLVIEVGLLDLGYHLPDLVRAVALAGILAGAGVIAYRLLYRPLTAPDDDLTLALRVEERFPSLNDSLASAVQFLEHAGPEPGDGNSAPLRREAVRRALGLAEGFDFNRVVNARDLRLLAGEAAVTVALALALLAVSPGYTLTALARLAHPFGGIDWPRKTRLALEPHRPFIGRNEPFELRGRVLGILPPRATITFRFEGFGRIEQQVEVRPEGDGSGRLEARLEAERIQHGPFRFQVRANDAVSPEYEVQVLPPPTLVPLDGQPSPQVTLHYPRYTGLPSPQPLTPGSGTVEAVVGTVVDLRAAVDRPLRRAWIEYQPENRFTILSAFLAPLGAPHAVAAASLLRGGRVFGDPVPATLDGARRRLRVRFLPPVYGMYALHFEDDNGLHATRLFELRIRPDPAPVVRLERPAPTRDVLNVLPDAVLTLEVIAEDNLYALRRVWLEYRTARDGPQQSSPLYAPATALRRWAGPWAGTSAAGAPPLRLRPPRLDLRGRLALREIHHPDGSPLHEGDVVVLRACADDFDDVSVDKEPGRSHEVEIHIVGRDALELALNQEQTRIQQELLRLREKERDALQKVTEAETRLRKGDRLGEEDLAQLVQAEQLQQQIRERIGDDKEGLRAEVRRVLEALRQNGKENSTARDRMREVLRELDRLAEAELQQIEPRLTSARQLAELNDEKARAGRRAELERQAAEAEREAADREREAARRTEDAARAEQQAGKTAQATEKARLQEEAKRQRQLAEELRAQAQKLRGQAERHRQEAARPGGQDQPRAALADARQHQEEVEKTLTDLLRRLEPWSNLREIKGEAVRLLRDQRELEKQVEGLQQQGFIGRQPEELTPRQRAELDAVRDAQRRIEERTNQLLNKMKRVGDQRAVQDSRTAEEVRQAAEQAEQGNLVGQMKTAGEQIRRNELAGAQQNQRGSAAELEKMVKNLEDRRADELDRLAKKLKQAEKELSELTRKQEELQKKARAATQIPDEKERAAALRRLAREQKELKKQTEEMLERLTRLRADRAGQALGRAGEEMNQAGEQLQGGREGEDQQEEALDRLDEARREVERARKQAEEELAREQLARVSEVIKRLKDRQEGHNREAARVQREVLRRKGWSRGLRGSLRNLGENQKGLGRETDGVARKDLQGSPVFARLLRRAGEAMDQAGQRLGQMVGQPPPPDQLPDPEATRLQAQALRRLEQLVATLKEAADMPPPGGQAGGGGGGGGEGGQGGGRGDGIPPLAQLKLLRTMQKDVNDRTETFRKDHPDLKKLDGPTKAELHSLRREQQDVTELVEELTRADEPGDDGDKK